MYAYRVRSGARAALGLTLVPFLKASHYAATRCLPDPRCRSMVQFAII